MVLLGRFVIPTGVWVACTRQSLFPHPVMNSLVGCVVGAIDWFLGTGAHRISWVQSFSLGLDNRRNGPRRTTEATH